MAVSIARTGFSMIVDGLTISNTSHTNPIYTQNSTHFLSLKNVVVAMLTMFYSNEFYLKHNLVKVSCGHVVAFSVNSLLKNRQSLQGFPKFAKGSTHMDLKCVVYESFQNE
uniref:Uncharacterized protein n=1 Tax=Glossina pallidipes TaxID=7398 RepID=A0A1A9ZDM1_GLOPL